MWQREQAEEWDGGGGGGEGRKNLTSCKLRFWLPPLPPFSLLSIAKDH